MTVLENTTEINRHG